MKTIFLLANGATGYSALPPHIPSTRAGKGLARIRLRLLIPQRHRQQPVLSHLVSKYGLSVNISQALLKESDRPGQFDLELTGTIAQIQAGLTYLASLDLVIQGKPNPDGDGWYC